MNDRFSSDDLPRRPGSAPPRSPWPIDLAHIRLFRIGDVEVRPATREVIGPGRREILEPLVMQVLVALASARGEILSRDDLIDACWGGRAVTDDAINRVLSRLRALARTFGSFQVETIIKVGYRLVEQTEGEAAARPTIAAEPESSRTRLSRRALVAGGAAATVLAAGAVLWRQPWRHRPSAEAREFFRRAEFAQRQGFSGQERQAISFYEQAVRIDPLYADAWGAMALAHTHLLEGYGSAEMMGVPDRLRSAARRALELDPDNADARLALILIRPWFRNWISLETELRRFRDRFPRQWLAPGRLANLLFDVGRIEEGIGLMKRMVRNDPMLPVAQAYLANALLNTDRLQEAEALLDEAQDRWPAHPSLWGARYKYLLFNSRPQAAGAFAQNPDLRPAGMDSDDVAPFVRAARAVDTQQPADVEASLEGFQARAIADYRNIPLSAAIFSMLGRPDLTFASLERYFFNAGSFGLPAPIHAYSRRYARELFSRPILRLSSDPRYISLLQRAGLEAYWRQTGTSPDYRRG